ncbi:MAG: D-sedoheptulose 7-phosphate isomerase [Candidatus Omnitrophica bacterium]|nr:D-sedoheptulose 7-phosphate isomerase [Candidatus Omnitrophota bacterium]
MEKIIKVAIDSHRQSLLSLEDQAEKIKEIANLFVNSLKRKGKIIFLGNGGSCADAQHLAAELVGRFKRNRTSVAALALSTNPCILTALGNDYGFEEIFSKQIEALADSKDIVVGISTSGISKNVIKAIKKAKEMGASTVGLLGKDGGELKDLVDIALIVKAYEVPRIQEMHILIGHILCEIVEEALFGEGKKT